MNTAAIIGQLQHLLGSENVVGGSAAERYHTDVYRSLKAPFAVIRPGSVELLREAVKLAADNAIGFTIRGGGASYTDGYNAVDEKHMLIDMGQLSAITINEPGGYVTVEAGVTWAQLSDALAAKGLRTPFRGPFSGLHASVAGSVAQHTLSHGSGGYGNSAESVLSLDVITGQGEMLRTGSAMLGEAPFARHFGPDLTGLFTGDCGALGIKARVTLPLLRQNAAHRAASFAFAEFSALHAAMRSIAAERIEDTHFSIDAALSQGQIARQDNAGGKLAMALGIVRSSPSLLSGVRQLIAGAAKTRKEIGAAAYTLHYIVEGSSDIEARAKLARIRTLIANGWEIEATVPAVVRAMPFAPFYNTLGPKGERWVPLHGILAHERVAAYHDDLQAFLASKQPELTQHGIWLGAMFSAVGTSGSCMSWRSIGPMR